LPNLLAWAQLGMKMSILRPLIFAPVSVTVYAPEYCGTDDSILTTDPTGNTRGSAAMVPRRVSDPDTVVPFWQYAVAVRRI
jgi:hypothetical protein